MSRDFLSLGPGPADEQENQTDSQPAAQSAAAPASQPERHQPDTAPEQQPVPPQTGLEEQNSRPAATGTDDMAQRFSRIVDSDYMRAAVGNDHYLTYRNRWMKMFRRCRDINKMPFQISLNLVALLIPVSWAGYRGVWRLVFLSSFALWAAMTYMLIHGVVPFLDVFAPTVFGLFADGLYFSKLSKKVEAQENWNEDTNKNTPPRFTSKGNGSYIRMVLAWAVFLTVAGVAMVPTEAVLKNMGYDVSVKRTFSIGALQGHQQQNYYQPGVY